LQRILLHYFIQKKSATLCNETYRILVETYGDYVLSETTCTDWFRRSKNNDFDVEDKERSGAPKKFENELETLLHENSYQTLPKLAESSRVNHITISKRLKVLGMIQKQGHWVLYKAEDVEQCLFTCELLLQR